MSLENILDYNYPLQGFMDEYKHFNQHLTQENNENG